MGFDMKACGRRIKSGIADKGMTYEQFAPMVGVSVPTVQAWVSGRSGISLSNAVAVADVFGWPLDRVAVRENGYETNKEVIG